MHEGHRDRMRKRLLSADKSLTDCELLEIFLYDCIGRKNTNPVAHDLLDSFNDLRGVFSATPRLLCMVAGIGPQTAEHIWLYGRLLERAGGIAAKERPNLRNYERVRAFVSSRFRAAQRERAEIYLLDDSGNLLFRQSPSGDGKPEQNPRYLTQFDKFHQTKPRRRYPRRGLIAASPQIKKRPGIPFSGTGPN